MMSIRNLFIILLIVASSNTSAFEILSKKEAERTFNKSLDAWKIDAIKLVSSGSGQVVRDSEISITMIVPVRNSILKITPVFKDGNLTKPWKIAVAVEQNKELTEKTKLIGEEGMRGLAAKWYKEMLPEYTVMTEFDLVGDTLQINFSIFEFGSNLVIDSVGKTTSGCWQGCIKK
jgi:hypothetical protein